MKHLNWIFAAFILVAGPQMALAQETTSETETTAAEETATEETTAPEAEAEAAEKPADATLADQAFPVEETDEAEVELGKEYVKDTYGAWQINCLRREKGDVCNMYQLLRDETGNPTAEMTILALPDSAQAQAGVTLITPLGTLLTADAAIRIDAGKVARYPYSWCERSGCFARFGLTAGNVASYKRGAKAVVSITAVANPEKTIPLDMSLDGFTAAFDALRALR